MPDAANSLCKAPDTAARVAELLTPVVLGTQALAVNSKHAHWNVRGENFYSIHQLLDSVAAHASEGADSAAERVVALGVPVDARLTTIAEESGRTEIDRGFSPWDATVQAVVSDIDSLMSVVAVAIEGLDGLDYPAQDIASEIKRRLEKDSWLLSAHTSGRPES